jgi:ribonucleoside-diphosphate reductase alpha chain
MTDNYLPTLYQQVIAKSRYSRWRDDLGRRETWEETVDRYMQNVVISNLSQHDSTYGDDALVNEIRQAILTLEVMPSMRMLMCAGPALDRDHMAAYNCSFVAMDNPRAFDEILYILTCGTGVGFSCESQYINKMPEVAEEFHDTDTTIVVSDSRIGWASSFRELIQLLYGGKVPKIDVSKVRAKGERLKTFGGRASGPDPLVELFNYTTHLFRNAAGRKLTDIEVHGLVCKIGEVVVVGGVRRSALISLSDLRSARMRSAKNGNWWERYPEFALANNSAVYDEKPTTGEFLEEWTSLYESKSGERGIYYRKGIRQKTDRIGRRDSSLIIGTNPCGEIALRSAGLCNLTEIVVRSTDTISDLRRKARIATILGTIQSTYTDFRYVRNVWKRNAEEERLLGVSLTGIYDNRLLNGSIEAGLSKSLQELKEYCGEVNREFADRLGINPSVAISTVKPSGTVSQLVDSSSGIHPRHSQYYIRSIRQDNKDPLTQFLKDSGVPNEPDVMKPDATTVFFFPVAAPEGATTRADVTPRKHLDLWKIYNDHWAEHQVSVTVSVNEDEWVDTAGWVFDNFDSLSGVSFLPMDGGTYRQAPYQECTKEQYQELLEAMPKMLDWDKFPSYEKEDNTTSSHELACVGDKCDITY